MRCENQHVGLSKQDSWLPILRWKDDNNSNGFVVPIFVSKELSKDDSLGLGKGVTDPQSLLEALQEYPSFTGMQYWMRNMQKPEVMKGGKARDAFVRLSDSPSCHALGFTPHVDRKVELILACFNIPHKLVETQMHAELEHIGVDVGWGTEWFLSRFEELVKAIQQRTRRNNKVLAVKFLGGYSEFEDFNLTQAVRPFLWPDTPTFADIGHLARVCRRGESLEVVSNVWCPLRYEFDHEKLPTTYYDLPDDVLSIPGYKALAGQLREQGTGGEFMIPDLTIIRGAIQCRGIRQKINEHYHIGSVSKDSSLKVIPENNEWLVEDDVFQIDFSVLVQVTERFEIGPDMNLKRADFWISD